MLKSITKSTFIFILFCLPVMSNGQKNELKNYLSEKENKKIASSEKLIKKGDEIIGKISSLEEEVNALKNTEGRIKTRKINKLNKQIADAKLKAAVYFEDGYEKHLNVLDKRIKAMEKEGHSDATQTRNEVKALEKKANKQYNKAERLSSPDEMVEMVELAQENQNKAIEIQEAFLLSALNIESQDEIIAETTASVEEATVEPTDSISANNQPPVENTLNEQTTTEAVEPIVEPASVATSVSTPLGNAALVGAGAATVAVVATEPEPSPVETTLNEEIEQPVVAEAEEETTSEVKDVFLSIQFLADKEKATESQIKQAYSGNLKVIEKVGSGWYRYSVGQFTDATTARETMQKEGIKGFIVAYNKDVRISVKEALEIINK